MSSMITLTVSDRLPIKDGRLFKKMLNRFLTELRRSYPGCEYVWVLEFQKNNQPHYHVLTNIEPSQKDRRWLGSKWSQAVLVNPPAIWAEHRSIADDLYAVHSHKDAWQRLRSKDGAQRYILSYIGKERQKVVPGDYENPGRFWGMSRGVAIEREPDEFWPIDEHTLRKMLKGAGLVDVSNWEYLPKFIHFPPINEGARSVKS